MASADVTATYGIDLAVEGVDDVEEAAKSLETLREELANDTAALGQMQKALRNMQGGVVVNIQAARSLRAAIAAKKVEIAQASTKLVGMKGAFQQLKPVIKPTEDATKKHAEAVKALKGELFGAEKTFFGLRGSTLASVGPTLMLVAAMAALTIAVGAAAVALFKFGVAAADARRNEQIELQAAGTKIWYGYAGAIRFAADETEAGAKAMSGAIDRITGSTTAGREKILGYAKDLEKAGLRGQQLETALKAVSTAASVGKEGGLVEMFASLRFAGAGVDNLAGRIQQKLGPLVERKLLSLDSQFDRLKENFSLLFKNVDVTPLLKALDRVLGLFAQTKAVGYALRVAIEALFPTKSAQTFGDVAAQVFKEVVIQGLRVTVGVLTLELMFYRLKNAVSKALNTDIVKLWAESFKLGIKAVYEALSTLIPILPRLEGGLVDKAADLGKNMGEGLAQGMNQSTPEITTSARGMGMGAISGFRESVDAHSPSREFFKAGQDVAAGAEKGIDAGASRVQSAADNLGPAPTRGPGGGKGPIQLSITIAEGAIQIHASGKEGPALVQTFEDQLSDVLERMAQRLAATLETT